ncbi:pyruvate dehydrogenase E1 component [Escherichia coli]|nr:pyruvate dehydrogenase E1 component [Escherichia coli]
MSERFPNDVDPIETRDWLQAIESVIREEGVGACSVSDRPTAC